MFSLASAIYFFIICLLFSFSNGSSLIEDDMLIAFMKGQQRTTLSEYTTQKYEAYLGIVYFLKKNWQCENILENFGEFEREECPKYRKYLDILYEYLLREYVGIPAVKPKFVLKKRPIEIEWPIFYVLSSLTHISCFYFNLEANGMYYYRLERFFNFEFEPKLLNEKKLKYEIKSENEQKMPNNEVILQLAIDTANECPNESVEEIIKQNFDRNLYEMFKKAEERTPPKLENSLYYPTNDKHLIIVESKFDGSHRWYKDALLTEFLKEQAMNFGKMRVRGECGRIVWPRNPNEYPCSYKKTEEDKAQKKEAHFGVVYLMKKHWQCDKIGKEFDEKCRKYRKYLDILYEYLFRIYAEAKNSEISKQLPTVKPIIIVTYNGLQLFQSLSDIVRILNYFSKCFWKKGDEKLNELDDFEDDLELNLLNEEEMNYEENKEEKIEMLRSEFDEEMEKICENAKRNAAEEAKVVEDEGNSEQQNKMKKYVYDGKFDLLNSSPFS